MQKNISDFFSLNPGQPNKNPTPNMNPHSAPVMKATQDILRLPTHTRGLWGFSKPLLVGIANAALPTVESILEVICKLIVECRIIQSRDLDISVLSEYLSINDSSQMMQTFKNIAGYALEVEYLFVEPVKLSTRQNSSSVHLNSLQVRCLLALQFFCCFPKQETRFNMPKDYTYARIFNKSHADPQSQMAKISCTLNYFSRQERPDELFLTFTRKVLKNPMNWGNLITNLSNVEIIERENGTEDFRDKIMIDFANKFIGGGALGSGTVQEEIMFHKHVEPLVSMLFTEQLDDNEALIIKGAQRFNETRGFKSDFRFVGDFRELISVDEYKRNDSIISAIDAIYYKGNENIQYDKAQILRELNKAYIGFDADSNEIIKRGVITGRWGCGAFAGNDQLKFIIQWLAASALGKEMYFLPWDMQDLNDLRAFIQIASQYNISKLFAATCRAGRPPNLLNEILQVLTSG